MTRRMHRHRRLPILFFSLLITLFVMLGALHAFARMFDDGKNVHGALEVLRDAIIDAARTNTTDPISDALSAFAYWDRNTFWLAFQDGQPIKTCFFVDETVKSQCLDWSEDDSPRPPNVSAEEWERFGRLLDSDGLSEVTSPVEDLSFNLIDLDEDGVRDLLVQTPSQGTGLWERTYAFQTDDAAGFRVAGRDENGPYSFDVNGRGSDHDLHLLRIDGRSYFAFRAAEYGEEVITLHRPLLSSDSDDAEEAVRVWYDVGHSVDVDVDIREHNADTSADASDINRAVLDQLNLILQGRAQADDRCPVPADQREQIRDDWDEDPDTYWPWVYAINAYLDRHDVFAVKTPDACYQAQLMSPRGGGVYSWGYAGCCWVELQDGPYSESISIPIETQRTFEGAELTPFSGHDFR